MSSLLRMKKKIAKQITNQRKVNETVCPCLVLRNFSSDANEVYERLIEKKKLFFFSSARDKNKLEKPSQIFINRLTTRSI